MACRITDRMRSVQKAAQMVIEKFYEEHEDAPKGGGCLFYAAVANVLLGAQVVAGSAQWQFRKDDGVSNTHYSYMFGTPAAPGDEMSRFGVGGLPEMHVWNALGGKVFDMSTIELPELVRRALGRGFDAVYTPPSIYYGPWRKKSKIIYTPYVAATKLALEKIEELGIQVEEF